VLLIAAGRLPAAEDPRIRGTLAAIEKACCATAS
jgi:hypothetical protein